jgi:hypothetical protein
LQLIRRFSFMAMALVSQASSAQDTNAAPSTEARPEIAGAGSGPDTAPIQQASWVVGLSALALMQSERREHRGVPRMLPLMAAQTQHGRLWVGLTPERKEVQGSREWRLMACWLIPLGQ